MRYLLSLLNGRSLGIICGTVGGFGGIGIHSIAMSFFDQILLALARLIIGALIAGICGYFAKDVYNWIKKGVFKKIAEIKKKRKRKKYPYIDTD